MRIRTTSETTETASTASSRSAGRSAPEAAGILVAKLFDEHARMVLGLCRLLLRDPVEAEDAAQQVFLSAHTAVLRGSLPRDAQPWLVAIARNECRARIHARMREPLALSELGSDLRDPLSSAIYAADLEAIWAAVSKLPRKQRRALLLRELGGLSYHELGRALGVSHSSVESLLFRARRQIRSLVAATTPFALRDDLVRLIPGFDPAGAGLAARVSSLPITVKLATAALGVGALTTGAAQFPEQHARRSAQARQNATQLARPARPESARRPVAVLAEREAASQPTLRRERDDGALRSEERPDRPKPVEAAEQVEVPQTDDGGGNSGISGPSSNAPGSGPDTSTASERAGSDGSGSGTEESLTSGAGSHVDGVGD